MKTLRFLATGDVHCHNYKQFSYTRKDGTNSRLHNCLKVFDIIRREAGKRKIDKVLVNGDVLEETDYVNVPVYDAVFRKFEKLHDAGIETVVNLGNHDVCAQSSGRALHSLRPFRRVSRIVEEPTLVWNHLQVVPWMENPEAFKRFVAGCRAGTDRGLVAHCGVQGARTGPNAYLVRNQIKLEDIRPDDFAFCILSDYHTEQSLARNVWYLGSPLQHGFGEHHSPGIWEIEMLREPPFYFARKIPTALPRFRRAKAGIPAAEIREIERQFEKHPRDYFRVELPAESEIQPEDIERLAHEHRCQIQVFREASGNRSVAAVPDSVDIPKAIRAYVRAQGIKSRFQRRGLRELGNRLFRREKG